MKDIYNIALKPSRNNAVKRELVFFEKQLIIASSILHQAQSAQHIYITNRDEIVDGDYFISIITGDVMKAEGRIYSPLDDKIIASSNPKLDIPLLSQSHKEIYVKEYKDNCFRQVEMLISSIGEVTHFKPYYDNYSRDKLIEFCKKAIKDSNTQPLTKLCLEEKANNWVKNNI